jgi:hypothetical protein
MKLYPYPYKDNRGTVVKIGHRVAFNISGDVAVGDVVGISRGGVISIMLLHQADGKNTGHISKVKKPQSLIVLRREEN